MNFKQRITAGECLLGACIYSNSPQIIECGAVGMDWIWWDAQHTHGDWSTIAHGVRTANLMNIPALIRTWTQDPGTIERLLDTGAEGIIVPMVETPEQARRIVAHCTYPPLGNRSFGSIRMDYLEKDLEKWNRRIVTIMQIETPQGVENAEAIARVPGVDALNVGARDLALRLGRHVHEDTANTVVASQTDRVAEACARAGKAAAIIAFSESDMEACIRKGYRLICAGVDTSHVCEAHQRFGKAFGEAVRMLRKDPNPD